MYKILCIDIDMYTHNHLLCGAYDFWFISPQLASTNLVFINPVECQSPAGSCWCGWCCSHSQGSWPWSVRSSCPPMWCLDLLNNWWVQESSGECRLIYIYIYNMYMYIYNMYMYIYIWCIYIYVLFPITDVLQVVGLNTDSSTVIRQGIRDPHQIG